MRARFGIAALAVALALTVYGLSSADRRLAQAPAPLILLAIPLALAAIAYGVKGGLGFGLFAACLGLAWWIQHGDPGGPAWIAARATICVVLGGTLGWSADSRQALSREIAHHRELSLDLIATASFDGYFVQVNPAFTQALGYSAKELTSTPMLEFVHPDDRETTLAAAREQIEAGRDVYGLQNRYRAKDGSYRWLEWTSRPDPDARTLVAVARDVTDRKLLEQHERRYQEELERAVADRTRQLEEARRETVARLALVAEYRDNDLREHPARVGETAALIAGRLGLPADEVALIREAALLHDVGKVGIPDAILLKPARLTSVEFEHVKRHSTIGANILSGSTSSLLRMAEEIARGHHEWWDGSGYPLGLRGEQIPIAARIVAVADVFDAITHSRPYQKARPIVEAVAEISGLSGRQFDPAVVDAFAALDVADLAALPHAGLLDAGLAETAGRPQPRRLGQMSPPRLAGSWPRRARAQTASMRLDAPGRVSEGPGADR